MSVLNSEMKRLVERQKLGFVATVCPDGTPNLSEGAITALRLALPRCEIIA
jgi:hypothetical protein